MSSQETGVDRIIGNGTDVWNNPGLCVNPNPRLGLFGGRCSRSDADNAFAGASLYFADNATFQSVYTVGSTSVDFRNYVGPADLCDIVRVVRVGLAAPIRKTSCFWKLVIDHGSECASAESMSPNYSFHRVSPSRREFAYVHAISTEATDIKTAHKEIAELLQAMTRGEPLARSSEFLELCGKIADQIDASHEIVEVDRWAERLATDLSEFMD